MKSFLRDFLRSLGILPLWSLCRPDASLKRRGWYRSIRLHRPVDSSGVEIPWYTYPAISFLETRPFESVEVFEYGMGHSTVWWSRRVASIVCCDHDTAFEAEMRSKLPGNAKSLGAFEDQEGYVRSVSRLQRAFGLIVVDGEWRNECIREAIAHLTPEGVILLDNSEREEYDPGRRELEDAGFREIRFTGMGPINHYEWSTSIFYRTANCLGI